MDKTEDFILKPRSIYDFKPQEKLVYDTIIIGTGIAGFSAAMYAARLDLELWFWELVLVQNSLLEEL